MRTSVLFVALAFTLLVGCGQNPNKEPIPTTHKVVGVVLTRDGKPFTLGGSISFQHDDETKRNVTTTGAIKAEDGSFTLQSVSAQHNLAGAQEGSYQVTVIPTSPDQSIAPIQLQKKHLVKAGENNITVRMEK